MSGQPDSAGSCVRLSESERLLSAVHRLFADDPAGRDAASGTGAPLSGALATMNVGSAGAGGAPRIQRQQCACNTEASRQDRVKESSVVRAMSPCAGVDQLAVDR